MTPATLHELQQSLAHDLQAFQPELVVCGTIVVLLLLRLISVFDRWHLGWVALAGSLLAVFLSLQQVLDPLFSLYVNTRASTAVASAQPLFTGLLVSDTLTAYLRLFLYGFAAFVTWLCLLTGIPDREDSGDFFCLLLGATLGMALMASANHLLMVFIAVEMASLPSYALAGFLKGKRASSEAALKYVVYGGGAAGVMLYGISLIAGKFGTGYLPEVAAGFLNAPAFDPLLLLGTLFVLIGIAFKLAAVPFHFWCPDVFEGAAAEVAGFLSVASKGAALALLARLTLALAGLAALGEQPMHEAWPKVAAYLLPALAFFSALTATFGNFAAYFQNNLKRLLAYSTIAHAGYMMMALASLNRDGTSAMLFYLVAYLFMNLGAFAVVAFLRNLTGSEDLTSFRGLIHRAPLLVITLAIFLLSLLGIPPLAGFAAKFQVFGVLYQAGQDYGAAGLSGLSLIMYTLLVIGGLNTVLSAFYYIRVLKVMILDRPLEEVEGRPSAPLPLRTGPATYAVVFAVMLFVLGILWDPLTRMSDAFAGGAFQALPREVKGRPMQGVVGEVRQ
jgi:NADH-quinone oxidoreductase subunit N